MYHTQQPMAVYVSRDQLIGGFPSSSYSSGYPYGGPIIAYMGKPSSFYQKQPYHRPVKTIAAIDLSSGQTVRFVPQSSTAIFPKQQAVLQKQGGEGASVVYLNPNSYYY